MHDLAEAKLLRVRELANDFRGPDQARPAQQDFQWRDGAVKADRKILLQTAHGQASAKEFRYPPMREKRDLEDAVCETKLDCARAEIPFYGRRAMREREQPDIQPGGHQPMHRGEQRERSFAFTQLAVN